MRQSGNLGTLWVTPLTILALALLWAPSVRAAEEFAGPFPSWRNVQRDYGAKGDGKTDDTDAIQRAFDDLQKHVNACVLYFPAGTYRITRSVKTTRKAHTDCLGVSIVGQDPTRTVLRWDGPAGGTMLQYDAWYSTMRRLTLDGAGTAGIALAYGDAFSTYNETSDMVFRDVGTGMQMATADNGQAENTVLRCRFLRCSNAGLTTVNFNSLDIWCWYCRFEDCGHGLYNAAGNFHAYQCLFLRSKEADIGTRNLMVFSFVNNTSIGSKCFLDFRGGHTWGSPCSITGNRIIDPLECAIRLSNGGPYLLVDNTIRSRPGSVGPVVEMTWGDQTLVGNRYTVSDPVKEAGRFRRVAEKIVKPDTIDPAPPTLPATPGPFSGRVFDVSPGVDASVIQAAIDAAARRKGEAAVVHLPMGQYKIDRTLTIPAGCDLRIVGDGGAETATVLRWTGPQGGTVLRLKGPSHAQLRDLFVDSGRGDGIVVENCDQPGGLIYGNQVNVQGRSEQDAPLYGLFVNGLEQSDAVFLCQQGGNCRTWIDVDGKPGLRAGSTRGQVALYCGATGTSEAQYAVRHGGRLVVRSIYHEMSGKSPQGVLLNDSGVLSIDATRFSYNTSADRPLIKVDGFHGDFGLFTELLLPVNSPHTARIEITGDGTAAHVLCMDDLFWQNADIQKSDAVWSNASTPPAQAALLLCNQNMSRGSAPYSTLDNRGRSDDTFLLRMLQPLRSARIPIPRTAGAGVTSVDLHRIICVAGRDGTCLKLLSGSNSAH